MALAHCGTLTRGVGPIAGRIPSLGAHRGRFVVRAGPDKKDDPSFDWDSAWRKFKSNGSARGPRPRPTTRPPS